MVDWNKVVLKENEIFLPEQGMGLDFGGFGKEFAVDQVSQKLKTLSCKNYLIDFGGDIFAAGYSAEGYGWKVGIERPEGEKNRPLSLTYPIKHWQHQGITVGFRS